MYTQSITLNLSNNLYFFFKFQITAGNLSAIFNVGVTTCHVSHTHNLSTLMHTNHPYWHASVHNHICSFSIKRTNNQGIPNKNLSLLCARKYFSLFTSLFFFLQIFHFPISGTNSSSTFHNSIQNITSHSYIISFYH